MAIGIETHEDETLRKLLAVAVRSIQWSYAIFWSLSSSQQGVLEWGNGYYNGDVKTRKTFQAVELTPDKTGLLRSKQLRQLYESLQEGESEQEQAKRPSASLSPEDLSDEEWYYLVCMSFVFNPGEGLVGRALANDRTIWLCNAQYADSKVFSRSLLAKSASIQTVVCFPYLGGVIELGVTELVQEDPNLLQHVKVALLEFSKPICSEKSSFVPQNGDDDDDNKEPICLKIDVDISEKLVIEMKPHEHIQKEFNMDSPTECSYDCDHNHETEDSFMVEGFNGGVSQVQSWHFVDDDFSNGFQGSMNSSDCISEALVSPDNNNNNNYNSTHNENDKDLHLKDVQECNHVKLSGLGLGADDILHYSRTISVVLRNSPLVVENQCFRQCGCKSSFMGWKNMVEGHRNPLTQQEVLKKILFKVPLMHGSCVLNSQKKGSAKEGILKGDGSARVPLPTNKCEDEKFLLLRSMVPSTNQIDKPTILNDAILYLKELEARVEELESCMDSTSLEGRSMRKFPDMGEQISDNYENRKSENGKKSWISKRKASDIDETDPELDQVPPKDDQPLGMKVNIKGPEVSIELRCPYREYLLLDIMEAINELHLDAYSVQSSTVDGVLTLALKSKFRGAAISPAGMIKQALGKITSKC